MSTEPSVGPGHAALLALMLGPLLLRTMVGYDALPWWGADPTIAYTPMVTLTPARSVLLDCISMAGALGVLMSRAGLNIRSASGAGRWAWVLVMLAMAGGARAVADGSAQGVSWGTAFLSCATLAVAGRHDQLRRIAAVLLMGCCAAWAGKGAVQLLVEHPLTVENFRQNKEAVLAAQGWTPGSASALAFERRLVQAEASGWFALANVYAAACAGCLAFFAGAGASLAGGHSSARRSTPRWLWISLLAGTACSAAGVIMSGSKGGLAAAVLAVTLAAIVFGVSRFRRVAQPSDRASVASIDVRLSTHSARGLWWGGVLGVACVLGVLILVAVRGAFGERLGELSVLFRWFYMEGAARAFAAQPFLGVGVEGFRDAYMLFKPPLSPEEVTSPHSVFFDMAACLGLAGFAVIGLLMWCAWRAGRVVASAGHEQSARESAGREQDINSGLWLVPALTATLVTFAAIWIELDVYTAEAALVRLAGLGAWIGLSKLLISPGMSVLAAPVRTGTACSALVLLAHAQIEMSAVAIVSCGWVFAAIGLGAASQNEHLPEKSRSMVIVHRRAGLWLTGIAIGLAITACLMRLSSLWQAERSMARAAALFEPIWLEIERARARAGGEFQMPLSALRDIEKRVPEAADILRKGAGNSFEIARAIAGLDLRAAAGRRDLAVLRNIAEGVEARAAHSGTAAAWGWAGTTWRVVAEQFGPHADGTSDAFQRALAALERASRLDPYGLTWPLTAFRVAEAAGNHAAARRWGEEALRRSDFSRLDPLRQLTPEDTARIGRVLAASPPPPGS